MLNQTLIKIYRFYFRHGLYKCKVRDKTFYSNIINLVYNLAVTKSKMWDIQKVALSFFVGLYLINKGAIRLKSSIGPSDRMQAI